MQHPYKKYEKDKTWGIVYDLISDLLNNNDIELKTPIEYVVGYICKGLFDSHAITIKGKVFTDQNSIEKLSDNR